MIEAIISLLAMMGFGMGDGEEPAPSAQAPMHQQEIIRAIDSNELQGFDKLEMHQADEWFV